MSAVDTGNLHLQGDVFLAIERIRLRSEALLAQMKLDGRIGPGAVRTLMQHIDAEVQKLNWVACQLENEICRKANERDRKASP